MIAWIGLTLMVSTRLWLGGAVSLTRDKVLAGRLISQVRACAQALCALLICTDGWSAYPGSMRRAFRDKVKRTAGPERASFQIWPRLHIGTIIKRTAKKRVTAIARRLAAGMWEGAEHLLKRSREGTVFNTAFIERFNGTMLERLATLTRKCRHPARRLQALHAGMYLIGCTSNFCWPHHTPPRTKRRGTSITRRERLYASHGQWPDRSCLERVGGVEVSHCATVLLGPKTARTSTSPPTA